MGFGSTTSYDALLKLKGLHLFIASVAFLSFFFKSCPNLIFISIVELNDTYVFRLLQSVASSCMGSSAARPSSISAPHAAHSASASACNSPAPAAAPNA